MSDIRFNRRRKDDGKGAGKIRLGGGSDAADNANDNSNDSKSSSAPKKGFLQTTFGKVAVGVGVAAVLATGVLMFTGGSDEPEVTTPRQIETVVEQPQQTTPAITEASILRQATQEKMASLYQDSPNRLYEAFMNAAGREVARGQDFAVYVGLFNTGGISVLITEGDHAGTRIGFFPLSDRNRPELVLERVGQQAVGADGQTIRYERLPTSERSVVRDNLRDPATNGSGVSVNEGAWFDKTVTQGSQTATAFSVSGSPVVDGKFSITIWNGDSYTIDLNTGEYSISSAFVTNPGWQPGTPVTATNSHGRVARP